MSNITYQAPLDRDSRASGNSEEHRGGSVATGTGVAGSAPGLDSGVAVEVMHLRKAYGATVAVDDVSFSVAEGEIFGILGPNGAGKTTTVECVIGLRFPDAGTIRVMGLHPHADREDLHAAVGVQLQASALPGCLKVGEILDLYHSFYRDAADLGEIMDSLGLAEKRNAYYRSCRVGSSSGCRSRWHSSAIPRSRCSTR